MSLQQTKTYNKEESMAKQAVEEAAKIAVSSQKKRPPRKADPTAQSQQQNNGQENTESSILQDNANDENQELDEESKVEEDQVQQELTESELKAQRDKEAEEKILQKMKERQEEDPSSQAGGKKKIIIYEQGNMTSTFDQDIQFPQQTLRYGDIITITFDKKVQKDNKFSFFNGILYSNGVTKLNLDIISKKFKENREAFCNFKCTLFKIESCSSYKLNQKMETLKQRRIQLEQEEDLGTAKTQDIKDIGQYLEQQKQKLRDLNKSIQTLQEELDKENKDNKYLNNHIRGRKVLYGDLILLRHLESDMYLSLNQNEAAEENGCVACKLMPLNEHSMISIVPQDILRQPGQIINYQDSFFIQNYIEPTANKQAKYLHTSLYKLEKDDEPDKVLDAVLEVNGSSDTTSYKARLFQPYDFFLNTVESQEENVFSGDVVKFYHKQSNGYLTVKMPKKSKDLLYNTRILREKEEFHETEKKLGAIMKKYSQDEKKNSAQEENKDGEEQTIKKRKQQAEVEETEPQIQIEIDTVENNKAKYLWEIQKLKPFVIKQVNTIDYYRIKHAQTGLYLCVKKPPQPENANDKNYNSNLRGSKGKKQDEKQRDKQDGIEADKNKPPENKSLELSLRELDDEYEFLFSVQKDTKVEDTVQRKSEPVKNLTMIILSTFEDNLRVQAAPKTVDQLNPEKEIKSSIFKTADQVKNADPVNVMCMEAPKDSQSRMLFTIQKAKRSQATLVRASSNLYGNAIYFFKKLNNFGEVTEQEYQDLNNSNKEQEQLVKGQELVKQAILHKLEEKKLEEGMGDLILPSKQESDEIKYFVYKQAKAKESRLKRRAKHFVSNIINLKQSLRHLQENNAEEYRLYQNYLDDSGVIDVLIKLLDLVNIKITPQDQRYLFSKQKRNFEFFRLNKSVFVDSQNYEEELKELEPLKCYLESETDYKLKEQNQMNLIDSVIGRQQNQGKGKNKNANDTPFYITNQIVKHIPGEILSVILLMIIGNEKVDRKLDKYPTILFQQLLGDNVRKAKKIFKISYGLSRLTSSRGDFQSCAESNEKQIGNQLSLKRWIDLIFDPVFVDEKTQNLKQQVIFFKVISLICQDQKGEGIFENQQLAFKKLLKKDTKTRQIHFSMQEVQGNIQPYIQFSLRSRKAKANKVGEQQEIENELKADLDLFYKQNPSLKLLIDKKDEKSSEYKKSYKTPPIKLLSIFDNDPQSNQDYWPYAQYLCAYLDFLITCIRNGQKHAKFFPNYIGLDGLFILNLIDLTKSYKLKVILIKLLTFLYINNDIIYGEYAISNRCYYWSKVTPEQMHHKNLQYSENADEDEIKENQANLKKIEGEENKKEDKATKEEKMKRKAEWNEQKDRVYKILPKMIEKILLVDTRWEDEESQVLKPEQDKEWQEIEAKPKQRLSLIIAALESSLELICCEKSSPVIIFKIIYASAIVFSWFKYRKNQDKIQNKGEVNQEDDQKDNKFKNFRLFKLLQKSRTIPSCRDLIDEVFELLLRNLIDICVKRTDQQVMIALKSFKSQQQKNPLTEILAQSFKKKLQKQGQKQIKGEEAKNDSFYNTLSSLYSLEANGMPVLSENFIKSLQNEKLKRSCANLNELYTKKGDRFLKYNLKEYLLFLIFDKKLNPNIKNMAFEVLMQNFETDKYFREEVNKVFLVVDDMEKQYRRFQKLRYSILENAQDIIWESFKIHHFSNEQKMESKYLKTVEKVRDNVTQFEYQIENLMDQLDFSDPNFGLKQKMLNFLQIPKLFIDYIMKNVNFKKRLHLELFKLIMDFLYVYSHQNPENSESLISQLDFLSSLQQIDIQNEKLITQIVKQLKNQERESQLIDHIIKQINRLSKFDLVRIEQKKQSYKHSDYYNKIFKVEDNEQPRLKSTRQICSLLKSLNLLAQDSIFNKGNIFNKILKLEKFYDFLFFSSQKIKKKAEQKGKGYRASKEEENKYIDLILNCASEYKCFIKDAQQLQVDYLEINYNSNRISLTENQNKSYVNNVKRVKNNSLSRFNYILHRRLISLLIQCSQDQQNAIPQIAKIIPLDSLLKILKNLKTPYILKKKYLRLLLQIHLSQFDDQTNQTFFKEDSKLRRIFAYIVYEDLLEYPFALAFSLKNTKKKLKLETAIRDAQLKIAKYLIENQNELKTGQEAYRKLVSDKNVETHIKTYKSIKQIPHDILEQAVQERIHYYTEVAQTTNLTFQQNQLVQLLRQYHIKLQKSEDPHNENLEFNQEIQQQQPQSTIGNQLIQFEETPNPASLEMMIAPVKEKLEHKDNQKLRQLIVELQNEIDLNRNKIQQLRNSPGDKNQVVPDNYDPMNFKYLDTKNPGEYWRYLSSLSMSIDMKDGLIHFIKDFFQSIKWDISAEDIDKFRDFVLSPLSNIRKSLESVNAKNLNIVPNGDELLLRIEEAIDAINNAFQRSEDKMRGSKELEDQNATIMVGNQAEYLKTQVNFTPDTPLLKQSAKQPQSKVELSKKFNQTQNVSKNAGKALGEKVVRYALNKAIEDQDNSNNYTAGEIYHTPGGKTVSYAPLIQNQMRLVPTKDTQKLQKMYTQKINETKMKKFFQYQKEDNDEVLRPYFSQFIKTLIQKNIGLGELFGIMKSYDGQQTIPKDDFLKKVKEIVHFENTDNSFKFYSQIISYQIKKKKEDNQKSDDNSSGGQNVKDVYLGIFGELILQNYEEIVFKKTKAIFEQLVKKNYLVESSQYQTLKKGLKEFIKSIKTDSKLKSENDMKKIIDIIIMTFKEQQKKEDMVNFFDNMIAGLQVQDQRYYILQLLKGILDHYQQTSRDVNDKTLDVMKQDVKRFQTVIHIMKECKLSEQLIQYLSKTETEEVSFLSIQILNLLLEGMNRKMQEQLYEYIKINQDELEMAEYLKNKIELLTPVVIQQKFNQVSEYNLAHLTQYEQKQQEMKNAKGLDKYKNNQGNFILQEFEIEKEDEKSKELLKLQEQRAETIQKFCSILRFIQLLCDNCHLGFQNYFRDQLTIQQSRTSSSVYQTQIILEAIENTSSFNIIVIVANSFMRITENLKDLIYFDQTYFDEEDEEWQPCLSTLVASFFDVIIDFLYGPCEENQVLLSGWQKFLTTVDFYFNSQDIYFFAQNQSQKERFNLMFKSTLLLLGILENPNALKSQEILSSLYEGISFENLQKIMISIHRQKILAISGSEEIFKTRRRLNEDDEKNINEIRIYPKNSMRPSDEVIFEIGFNIFKFLYMSKRLNSLIPQLQSEPLSNQQRDFVERIHIDSMAKEKSNYVQRLYKEKVRESDLTLEFLKNQIVQLHSQNDEKISKDPQKFIKIYSFLQLRNQQIKQLESDAQKLKTQSQLKQLMSRGPNANKKSFKPQSDYEKSLHFSKLESVGMDNLLQNPTSVDINKSIMMLEKNEESSHHTIKKLINTFEKLEEEAFKKTINKITHEFDDIQDENYSGDGNQIQTQQALEYYQLELALQFYTEFIAEVEVDYQGTLVRSIFKIPSKCAFLSSKSRENILYGQQNNSLYDKLEGLFSHMNILIAEMKSNQRLSRKSKLRYWISTSNPAFQTMATLFIVMINLVYLIFYAYDRNSGTAVFTQQHVDIVVWVLAIAQAVIAFFIHLGYIEKYHGAYFQKHLESQKESLSEKFTNFKGSLGYAEGTKIKQEQRGIVETELHNLREQFNRSKRQKKKAQTFFKNIWYGIKIYFIGLNQDPIHAFNLLFFACSIGAIYQPFLFSILLLENVLQIPLLFNVIKAIVNNRKQILLTLLLLLVIVYVYSFVAFITFRDTYISLDTGDEPDYNSYCERLGYCFTSTLNNGVRSGGGIGDTLEQLSIEDDLYWGRYAFDLTFYIMIIVLLLNLIFGIIIDAFAAMRDQRNEVEREVQEKCYICGKASSVFESKKKSFEDHIQREHNVYAYIYYIFYLSRKPMAECTGVERYVQNMIIKEDPNFFPIDRSLGLEEQPLEDKALDQQSENMD